MCRTCVWSLPQPMVIFKQIGMVTAVEEALYEPSGA